MKKLLTAASAVAVSCLLTAGVVSAQAGDVNVDVSGPGGDSLVVDKGKVKMEVDNYNKLKLNNDVYQKADSGDAKVKMNTTGGDATTGDASNANALTVAASVDNSGGLGDMDCMCMGTGGDVDVDLSGPNADSKVILKNQVKVDINNTTILKVTNQVEQKAYTGDASVYSNTSGGDATTGDASNTNTVSTSFTVEN